MPLTKARHSEINTQMEKYMSQSYGIIHDSFRPLLYCRHAYTVSACTLLSRPNQYVCFACRPRPFAWPNGMIQWLFLLIHNRFAWVTVTKSTPIIIACGMSSRDLIISRCASMYTHVPYLSNHEVLNHMDDVAFFFFGSHENTCFTFCLTFFFCLHCLCIVLLAGI